MTTGGKSPAAEAINTTQSRPQLLKQFGSRSTGLKAAEVLKVRQQFGSNDLETHGKKSAVVIFFRQWKSPFVLILLIAAVISFALGELIDAFTIFGILLINNLLSFFQEFHSEKAVQKLQSIITDTVLVRRDNKIESVNRSEIVRGDILVAKPGTILAADVRWLETDRLEMNESVLTGESISVMKFMDPEQGNANTVLGFAGTHAVGGYGEGLVIATGAQSSLGKIIALTSSTKRVSSFEQGIKKLSNFILWLVIITLVIVFVANLIIKGTSEFIPQLLFSIALAVSVIPEALPAVVTITFTKGAMLLAKKKVVVRRLSAIEDLGHIQILCTDKTGTITENLLTLEEVKSTDPVHCLQVAGLAVEAESIDHSTASGISFDDAVLRFMGKKVSALKSWSVLWSVPFDPERKRTTNVAKQGKEVWLVSKGAAEVIVDFCSTDLAGRALTKTRKQEILQETKHMGTKGFRVLAVAYAPVAIQAQGKDYVEDNLVFCGLLAFADPLKASAKESIRRAKENGVQVKVLTGDSLEVARAVGIEVGILSPSDKVITGDEFDSMPASKRHQIVKGVHVFARVKPEQKFSIIQHLQHGATVGFLGEGINDAPALQLANVGLVVSNASDVAREAADIILLDRSLSVIIDGITEGRAIFTNISKYIRYTLIGNFGNFFAIAGISVLVPYLPMLPVQILLTNLLTDLPLMAVATDHVDPSDTRTPRFYNIREFAFLCLTLGIVSSMFDFIFFGLFFNESPAVIQTMWFITSIGTELLLIFSIRTRRSIFKAKLPSPVLTSLVVAAGTITLALPFIPFTRQAFHFVLPTSAWMITSGCLVLAYFICTEVAKLVYYAHAKSDNTGLHPVA